MLTTLHKPLAKAGRYKYAIPAFNCTNLESARAIINAAVKAKSPVIIQTSESAIKYAGHETILGIMETLAETVGKKIPVVTHIDHGKHFKTVKKSIELGYTSVHMDASEKSFVTNISLTKKAVVLGHRKRITVQGELGYLLGYEGMTKSAFAKKAIQEIMTDPDKAEEFVKKTGVDTLAIAVGTAHGYFKGKEFVDFKRLIEIRKKVQKPLVLHGGSGVSDKEIMRAIRNGIRIINVDTSLRLAFMKGLVPPVKAFNSKKKVDLRHPLGLAQDVMEKKAIEIIKLFGSAGRA